MTKQEKVEVLIKGYLYPHLLYSNTHSVNGVVNHLIKLLHKEGLVIKTGETTLFAASDSKHEFPIVFDQTVPILEEEKWLFFKEEV